VTVVRVFERLFPDLMQDVVLLLADGFGSRTAHVEYRVAESISDLGVEPTRSTATMPIASIIAGERSFMTALLPAALRHLLSEAIAPRTTAARHLATFNVGYVTGDKTFFHPTRDVVGKFRIPKSSLVPSIPTSRSIRSVGLYTSAISRRDLLFLPPLQRSELQPGDEAYIEYGAGTGVSGRYKCRVRQPWYVTPGVRVPDIVIPVFSDAPVLLLNDARLAASNSLLTGYLRTSSPTAFASSWYTTLTLLQVELNVHSLGGGVIVLVPGEAGAIRLATGIWSRGHLSLVGGYIRSGEVDAAYACGDDAVLMERLRLSRSEVAMVRDGVAVLRRWRRGRA
jgi:adenine-specific DNA-methyltransferase